MLLSQSAQDMVDLQLPGTSPAPGGVTPDAASMGVTPNSFWSLLVSKVIPAGLTAYQQIKLQDLNMSLIRQGRPPLTAAQMQAMAPQFNVGLASSTQTMLMYGGMAVLGLFALSMLGKPTKSTG